MASTGSPRVNYDQIAHLYDAQPYREKTVDEELTAFLASQSSDTGLTMLDYMFHHVQAKTRRHRPPRR